MDISATNVIALISVGAGVLSFIFGIFQYMKAQRWKKAEFAAREMEKLNTDVFLRTACVMLDWSRRKLKVPVDVIATTTDYIEHDWSEVELAMVGRLSPIGKNGFTAEQALYRDIFDRFFAFLKMLNHYVDIKLTHLNDISPIRYWLVQIFDSPLTKKKDLFCDYLNYFGFESVFELANKFDVIDDPKRQKTTVKTNNKQ